MRFFELLPVPKADIEDWAHKMLVEIHGILATVIEEDKEAELRQRNEQLASYLGTLNTLLSAKRQQLHHLRNRYIFNHPKPEKGVTEWREDVKAENYDIELLCEHIESVIESIQQRLSITQSNLKSLGREGRGN